MGKGSEVGYGWGVAGDVFGAVLPLCPSWNASYRATRGGRVYATRGVHAFKRDVERVLCGVRLSGLGWLGGGERLAFGVYGLGRRFTGGVRGSDSDSRLKVTKDAVFEALGLDDAAVVGDLTLVRRHVSDFSLVLVAPFRYYVVVADVFIEMERVGEPTLEAVLEAVVRRFVSA